MMLRVALIVTLVCGLAMAHVRMRGPPSRSSIWRDPAFAHLNPPVNYDDSGYNCGYEHQYEVVDHCGICGDAFNDARPRPNEDGGKYGVGIIVGNYRAGEEIAVNVEFTATHLGYFEAHLCTGVPETEQCFQTLQFGDGSTRYKVPVENQHAWVNTTVRLPQGVSCSQCVLRMHYRAGNGWGDCGDGTEGMGCGKQETFRNCADIAIQ